MPGLASTPKQRCPFPSTSSSLAEAGFGCRAAFRRLTDSVGRPRSIAENTPSAGLVRRPCRQYHLSLFGSKTGLVLVGTLHFDRQSYQALKTLLHALGSSVIATEMSEWGISFRYGRGRRLRSQLLRYVRRNGLSVHEAGELTALLSLLSFPHEYLAARTVSRATRASLVNLGRNRDSMAWLAPLLREPWDEHHMRRLATTGRRLTTELAYQRRRALSDETGGIRAGPRDRILARSIESLFGETTSAVAVLGWEHVSQNVPGNVASLLRSQNPLGFLVVDRATVRLY